MKINKNDIFRLVLASIAMLLILDSVTTQFVDDTIVIAATTGIMTFVLFSAAIYRSRKIKRILASNIKHWKYKKRRIDWNSLLTVVTLYIGQALVEGTIKQILLIQATLFLLTFLYNTLIYSTHNQHMLAIDTGKLTNIQNEIEEIELDHFKFSETEKDKIIFNTRWRSITIKKDDFSDSDDLLDIIKTHVKSQK